MIIWANIRITRERGVRIRGRGFVWVIHVLVMVINIVVVVVVVVINSFWHLWIQWLVFCPWVEGSWTQTINVELKEIGIGIRNGHLAGY